MEETGQVLRSGSVADVQRLIEKGALKVDRLDKAGFTPVMLAACAGNVEVLEYLLLRCGADPDIPNRSRGHTALRTAAGSGKLDVVRCLLQNGADHTIEDNRGYTAFMAAAGEGHALVVEYMVLHLGQHIVNSQTQNGTTALMLAAEKRHLDMVEYLVSHGANIHSLTTDHSTTLMWAARGGCDQIISYLIRQGASVNALNNAGCAAATFASRFGKIQALRCLLQCGASPNTITESGMTLPHEAVQAKCQEAVMVLLEADCEVDVANQAGWTPLMMAASMGCVQIVTALLKGGARLQIIDKDGLSAREIAQNKGYHDVVKVLDREQAARDSVTARHEMVDAIFAICEGRDIDQALQRVVGNSPLAAATVNDIASGQVLPPPGWALESHPLLLLARCEYLTTVQSLLRAGAVRPELTEAELSTVSPVGRALLQGKSIVPPDLTYPGDALYVILEGESARFPDWRPLAGRFEERIELVERYKLRGRLPPGLRFDELTGALTVVNPERLQRGHHLVSVQAVNALEQSAHPCSFAIAIQTDLERLLFDEGVSVTTVNKIVAELGTIQSLRRWYERVRESDRDAAIVAYLTEQLELQVIQRYDLKRILQDAIEGKSVGGPVVVVEEEEVADERDDITENDSEDPHRAATASVLIRHVYDVTREIRQMVEPQPIMMDRTPPLK